MLYGLLFLSVVAPAPDPVSDVVVYAEGALVTRRAQADCAPGKTASVAFPALPAAADPDSLQADATGARVVAVRWERPRPPEGPLAAERPLARARAELAAVEQRLARAEGAGDRADGYDELVERWAQRSLWRTGAAPARWAAAVETVVDERMSLARDQQAARARLRALKSEEATLARQLEAERAARRQPPVTAHVHLSCTGDAATVSLRYLVAGAGWAPVYEVRARDRTLELGTWATVHQETGEPWSDVRLSLSTARPGARATPPSLRPLKVWSEARDEDKRIVAATEEIPAAPTARIHGGTSAQRFVFIDRRGLATDLVVPGTSRVPADGAAVRVLVARTRHATQPRLRAAPRLAAATYRIAELVNDTPFPLLPGRLEIFRGDTFVGAQDLTDEVPVGSRLLVSFGVEERVRIDRVILREVERSAGLFGGVRHHQFAYRFHLASHLSAPEALELCDHLPVSQLDDVKVVLEPTTTPGHALDPHDGTVTWRVSLRPGEEKSLDLAFRVEVPSAYQ